MCASESSRVLDNMFELGSDRASLPKAEFKAPEASAKKFTISKKAETVFGVNNESMVTRDIDSCSNHTKKMPETQSKKFTAIELRLRGSSAPKTAIESKLRGSAAPKRIKKAQDKENMNLKRPKRGATPFNLS
jgi:hypothetical protein